MHAGDARLTRLYLTVWLNFYALPVRLIYDVLSAAIGFYFWLDILPYRIAQRHGVGCFHL